MDLVREILLVVEEHDHGFAPERIVVTGHTEEEVGYHVVLMGEAGLLRVHDETCFRNDVAFVRTVARASFRAPDPIKAAEGFIADYDAVVTELTSQGAEPTVARSLASIASIGAEPLETARNPLENFESVLRLAKNTHPSVARSVALSACRGRFLRVKVRPGERSRATPLSSRS